MGESQEFNQRLDALGQVCLEKIKEAKEAEKVLEKKIADFEEGRKKSRSILKNGRTMQGDRAWTGKKNVR